MKKSTTIYIGATFIVAIIIFIWGYNFLKGKDLFREQTVLHVRYHNVSGLVTANPILLNGMQIGQVSSVRFAPDYSGDIMVSLLINKPFPIPVDTKARIINATLLGDKSVELVLGKSKKMVQNNDTLEGSVEVDLKEQVNAALAPIKARAEQILTNADSLISAINDAFGRKGNNSLKASMQDLQSTFHNLNATTANLNEMVKTNEVKISHIISNVDSLSVTLSDNRQNIGDIVKNLKTVSDSLSRANLKETVANANRTLDELQKMIKKINAGQGTAGAIMNNDSLYLQVNKAILQLDKLLKDIRENPHRYLKFSVF
ncbi:MAG: MCE family protein [Bacteroidales bacterium]|nr:MCE family protein [Bacteroidales bacterium]